MCLLALAYQTVPGYPVVVAANRDEFYDRATEPPRPMAGNPWIVAGRDVKAGGTWLGVNRYGLVAALTNRHAGRAPNPDLPSRGQLCLDALRETDAATAAEHTTARSRNSPQNPFNLLVATPSAAWVLSDIDESPIPLKPGWHVIANQLIDAVDDPRVRRANTLIQNLSVDAIEALLPGLEDLCRDHGGQGNGGAEALCVHGDAAGTRSSTIIAVAADGKPALYRYADGPPCCVQYREITLPGSD